MNIETLLRDEIEGEFGKLGGLQIGTKEYEIAIEGITKLVDRAVDIDKINHEADAKHDDREIETEFKNRQMEEDRKDRIVRNGIAIAGIAVPTMVTIWGTLKSLKFEETGTITTNAGREFINRIFKK